MVATTTDLGLGCPGDGIAKRHRKTNLPLIGRLHPPGNRLVDHSTVCTESRRQLRRSVFSYPDLSHHARGDPDFLTLFTDQDRSRVQRSFYAGENRRYRSRPRAHCSDDWALRVAEVLTCALSKVDLRAASTGIR